MKKSIFIKITTTVLALSFVVPGAYVAYPAQRVEAQAAGSGGAVACVVGLLTATGLAVPGFVKEVLGVPTGEGATGQAASNSAANNSGSFTRCVLTPLAKNMVVALIRNIGSSVVNWVNSGFNGSPAFITNFSATFLDAADQAAGQFIEGSELGYLCNNFAFKIRIALALKYSQNFRQRSQCTLTKIENNIATNGGGGWDNFLQVTTEPRNNQYGAYVIADSELAQRMFNAVGNTEKEVAVGQGFLNFKTCDEYETSADQQAALDGLENLPGNDGTNDFKFSNTAQQLDSNDGGLSGSDIGSNLDSVNSPKLPSLPTKNLPKTLKVNPVGKIQSPTKPKCLKDSVKTPGGIIAGKLNSTFAQGDIQTAVAHEIDDVIAATMNQLAQKAIMGSQGLFGLSKKKSGSTTGTPANNGATSPIEDYQVQNYDAAEALVNGDPQVQQINDVTNTVANQTIAKQQAQQEAINSTFNSAPGSEQNLALLKLATESSLGAGPATNATDGLKDGVVTQRNQPSATNEEASPSWEVDLGSDKSIREVRIWKITNMPESKTLGTIDVRTTDASGNNVSTSDSVTPAPSGTNPIIISIGQTGRYVRIERHASDTNNPLAFVEVEVIGTSNSAGAAATSTSSSSDSSTGSNTQSDARTATSTLAWTSPTATGVISASSPFVYELHLTEQKPIEVGNNLVIRTYLKRNGSTVPYLSLFSSYDFIFGRQGEQTSNFSVTSANDSGDFTLTNITNSNPANYYMLKQTGQKKSNAPAGDYIIETTVEDMFGTIIKTATANFSVAQATTAVAGADLAE